MSLHRKYLSILSALVPSGALGMSVLLASSAPAVAREHPAGGELSATPLPKVSERLEAVRSAMSVVGSPIEATASSTGERQMAWANWGNGGVGIFVGPPWSNWNNWNNWRNNWSNWGNVSSYQKWHGHEHGYGYEREHEDEERDED